MRLIDRFPGGFITVAAIIVYATVGLECWMLVTGSIPFMGVVMAIIIAAAGLMVRWMSELMGPEAHELELEYEPEAIAATSPAQPALGRTAALSS